MAWVTMGVFCHDWSIPGAKLIILTLLSYVLPMRIVSAPGGKHFIALAELLQEIRPGRIIAGNPPRLRCPHGLDRESGQNPEQYPLLCVLKKGLYNMPLPLAGRRTVRTSQKTCRSHDYKLHRGITACRFVMMRCFQDIVPGMSLVR